MRFNCCFCNAKMIVLSRPLTQNHKSEKEHLFTVYLVCSGCGARAKSEQHLTMMTEPLGTF